MAKLMNDPVNLFIVNLLSLAGVYAFARFAFQTDNNWALAGWMLLSILCLHLYGYIYHRRQVLDSVK